MKALPSWRTFSRQMSSQAPTPTAEATAEPAADIVQVRAGLDAVVEQYPTVQILDQTEFKETIRAQINQLLFLIGFLLLFAIPVISLTREGVQIGCE